MSINKLKKFSPHTNNELYEVDIMSAKQVNCICSKAKLAFETWSKTSLKTRKEYLRNLISVIRSNSNRIIQTIMLDVEKPYCEAETEIIESCDILDYYCSETFDGIDEPIEITLNADIWPHKKAYGLYQPRGVYAVIKPWNYPFELGLWSMVPLLLAGNSIVYKPSELSTATGVLLVELINSAGFPDGVVNIIQGDAITGKHLVENENIKGISFTGSCQVGNEIFESTKNMEIKLSLEMGGSDFALVLNDAIDEITVPGILWGCFSNAGQVCVATEKVLISDTIYDRFVKKLIMETKKLKLRHEIPPVISQKQYSHAKFIIDEAIKHGGKILCGGTFPEDNNLKDGNYIYPTIIECKDYEFLSNVEEIFAPIVLIAPFDSEEKAIEIVNASKYGLGCSIWTGMNKKHTYLYRKLTVGMIWVNEVNLPMPQTPWIGVKSSGIGFNLSKNAVYDSMIFKSIHIDSDSTKRNWWYPYIQE